MNIKGMLKLGLTLAIFATAACVGLAFVYTGTAEVIAERQRADLDAALRELFPDADTFRDITGTIPSPDPLVVFESQYEARRGEELIGVAIRASRGSYGGAIKVLAGTGIDGRISRVRILDHSDTPGLGANAASPSYFVDKPSKLTFYGQFAGKPVSDPFEVKNDVAAVTASTITSRAVAESVKAAGDAAFEWLAANGAAANPGGSL
ncbi:MAG: FMN-binding protein [Spirochaetaceae bacterium]|jgi:electron transport complex protein RnfG|nr:FMN-binding protein [Spirochaetaceae bacterium]